LNLPKRYEDLTAKGDYISITAEELEKLAPEKSRDIHLRVFVMRDEIAPLYFEKGYVLTPAEFSNRAYRLLAKTMDSTNRAGIATFVMHGKEYLVAIFADGGILRAETMRFADEIRRPRDLRLPKRTKPSAASVRTFEKVIERLLKNALDRNEMRDEYAGRMLKLIESKHAKGKDIVESAYPAQKPAKVVDLMEVLKKSLAGRKTRRRG